MARGKFAALALLLFVQIAAFAADSVNLWLDVPFVKQERNGCGPASIAMVTQYWHQQPGTVAQPGATVRQIIRELQPDDKHGVRTAEMVRYFDRNGYRAFTFAGRWADLEREVAQGRPLIAALKPSAGNSLHYVVIVGIDDNKQVVLINDPAERKLLKQDRSQFEEEWKATGFWTLLAVPAAHAPAAQ